MRLIKPSLPIHSFILGKLLVTTTFQILMIKRVGTLGTVIGNCLILVLLTIEVTEMVEVDTIVMQVVVAIMMDVIIRNLPLVWEFLE